MGLHILWELLRWSSWREGWVSAILALPTSELLGSVHLAATSLRQEQGESAVVTL